MSDASSPQTPAAPISNIELALPYLAPYVAYLGVAQIPESLLPTAGNYALRLVATAAAIAWAWRWYLPLRGPGSIAASTVWGVIGGVFGTALWIALKRPFVAEPAGQAVGDAVWLGRLLASGLVVPIFEELTMRGYVLRVVLQWERARRAGLADPVGEALERRSVGEVEAGAWSALAVVVSTLLFTGLHDPMTEYPAAIAYGLLMAALWILRRDLWSCVVAHGVTNVTLAIWVRETGSWGVW